MLYFSEKLLRRLSRKLIHYCMLSSLWPHLTYPITYCTRLSGYLFVWLILWNSCQFASKICKINIPSHQNILALILSSYCTSSSNQTIRTYGLGYSGTSLAESTTSGSARPLFLEAIHVSNFIKYSNTLSTRSPLTQGIKNHHGLDKKGLQWLLLAMAVR